MCIRDSAYNAAAAGDTIKLKPGTYTASGAGGNYNISLQKNLIITSSDGAASTILDGGMVGYRFFDMSSSSLDTTMQIIGLTFKRGRNEYSGGAMLIAGTDPRIKNCVFDNNKSQNHGGGAIWINSGSPVFINCTFKNNTCKGEGGAIVMNGTDDSPVFRGCTFIGNNSLSTFSQYTTNYGGAIKIGLLATTFTPSFTDCVFDSNKVESGYYSGWGGAVYAIASHEDTPPLKFTRCYFRGNTAKGLQNGFGGALHANNMGVELVNCSITGNTATTNSSSLNYYGRGGAIYLNTSSDLKIINCTIADNTASSINSSYDWGGGIYAYSSASSEFTMFLSLIHI